MPWTNVSTKNSHQYFQLTLVKRINRTPIYKYATEECFTCSKDEEDNNVKTNNATPKINIKDQVQSANI